MVAIGLAAVLIGSALPFAPSTTAAWAAASDLCDGTSTQNNLKVSASHGSVFYIDSASSQKMDAAYLSYVVSGTSPTARTNLWMKVSNFSGGSVELADPADASQNIGSVSSSASKTSFFLVKANGPSLRAQSHLVAVYSGNPSLAGSELLYSCTFSFSKVKETIAANPNKVTAVTTTPSSTSNLPLGSTFTVTVTGDTGTIGSGSSPDADMMWVSPVARSTWPSRAIRLESSVVKFDDVASQVDACNSEGTCMFTNQLLIKNMLSKANAIKSNAKSLAYKATYTFRVVGKTAASVPILPIAQISSGTQVKHTPIPASALGSIGTDQVAINATLNKSMSSNAVVNGSAMEFKYTLTLQNSGSTAITADQIIDSKDPSLSYKAATVSASTFTSSSGGTGTALTSIATPSTDSQGRLVFTGPFTVPAGGRLEVTYWMTANCSSGTFQYTNSATAQIGALTIGSSASTYTQVVASGTCGNTTVTPVITQSTLAPEVVTLNATPVGQNSATLNGTVDPNGVSGATIEFLWGKNSGLSDQAALAAGATTNETTPYAVSASLTGLSSGSRYYFRIRTTTTQNGVTTTQLGEILSFLTTEPSGTPTITTDAPTGVTSTSATLNGTIDPNQTASQAGFSVSTSLNANGTLASPTRVILRDDMTLDYNSSSNPYTLFSGSFASGITLDLTNAAGSPVTLASNTTYYYTADYYTPGTNNAAGTLVSSGAVKSFKTVSYSSQTITFAQPSDRDFTVGSVTVSPTASSTLATALTSDSPSVCSVSGPSAGNFTISFLDVGACTLVATQDGGLRASDSTYFSAATAVVQTFNITLASRTLAINANSYASSYSDWAQAPPQITSTASVADTQGTKTYSVVGTTTICSINSVTGQVTFLKPGTCTVTAEISTGTQYNAASATPISFSIGTKTQTLDLPSESHSRSDGSTLLSASSNAATNTSGLGSYVYSVESQNNTAGCSVVSATLSFTQAGQCTVKVSRTGNDFWTSAETTATITINNKLERTLDLKARSNGSNVSVPGSVADWSANSVSLVAIPSETEVSDVLTYSLDPSSSGCEVDSATGELRFTGAGTCKVRSSVNEGSAYNSASSTVATIVIGKRTQEITNFAAATLSAPSGVHALNAGSNASSANAGITSASYSIASGSTPGCDIVAGELVFTQAGTCYVRAAKNGNDNWTEAESTVAFTIARASRSLTISPTSYAATISDWSENGPTLVTAASHDNSDGTKSFAVTGDSAVCSVDSATGRITLTGAGSCVVTSSITQGARYNSANSSPITITVGKRAQTLDFAGATIAVGVGEYVMAAATQAQTLTAGLGTFNYALATGETNSANCSISAGKLTFTSQGECTVEVSGSGNDHWDAATKTARFVINGKLGRSIGIKDKSQSPNSYDPAGYSSWSAEAPTLAPDPSASEDGDTYTYALDPGSSGCSVNSSTGQVSFTGAGTCKVKVSVSDGQRYNGAVSNVVSFTIGKKPQTITNLVNTEATVTANQVNLAAGSSADLDDATLTSDLGPVTYTLDAGSDPGCAINGSTLTFTAVGTCRVTAVRDASTNYQRGNKTVDFTIKRADRGISFDPGSYAASRQYSDWSVSAPQLAGVPSAGSGDGSVSYSVDGTSEICSVNSSTGAVTFIAPGTCKVKTTVGQGNRYNEASSSTLELTIGKRGQAITNHDARRASAPDGSVDLTATADALTAGATNTNGIGSITYTFFGPDTAGCQIAGGKLTFTKAGTCSVTATVAGNTHWDGASKTVLFTIDRANRSSTITPNGGVTSLETDETVQLTSNPSRGDGTKRWQATPSSVCTVNATGAVTARGAGVCQVTATHAETDLFTETSSTIELIIRGRQNVANPPAPGNQAAPPTTNRPSLPFLPVLPQQPPAASQGLPNTPPATPTNPRAQTQPTPRALPTPQVVLPEIGSRLVEGAPPRTSNSVDTVDLGNGPVPASVGAVLGAAAQNLGSIAQKTLDTVASEVFGGFAPGSATWLEVIGARTTGQFIVTPGNAADAITIAEALNESTSRNATDFAAIGQIQPTNAPARSSLTAGDVDETALTTFAESGLDRPRTLTDLDLESAESWLAMSADVSAFKPGSVVYLAVTTDPIILGAAVVDENGTARIDGYLPVDLLTEGGHNVRVVGTRELGGITTGADGTVKISDATLSEIRRFDQGTLATVKVLGQNETGGVNAAVRQVWLEKDVPWWTIILVSIFALLALATRVLARRKWILKYQVTAGAAVAASTLPAIVLGWITSSYDVIWFGILIGLIGQGVVWVPRFRRRRPNLA